LFQIDEPEEMEDQRHQAPQLEPQIQEQVEEDHKENYRQESSPKGL
jgi:hypothetical protein